MLQKALSTRCKGEKDVEKIIEIFEQSEKDWEENKPKMQEQVEALKLECADLQEKIKVKKEANQAEEKKED